MTQNNSEYTQIVNKVTKFCFDNDLINSGDTVVVATSGGADSVALLKFMVEQYGNSEISIVQATVNHGIRDESADRDMMHVQEIQNQLGIRCIVFNAKTDGTVIPPDASEEWARELRYSYFKKLPQILGVPESKLKIATAHTAQDQAETLLFRLQRNQSYKSLMGIPVKRGQFIRPFLCLTREDTEQICKHFSIDFMIDETNLGDDYSRNKIRHHVLPVLRKINSNAVQHLNELAMFNTRLNDYFTNKAIIIYKSSVVDNNCWNRQEILKYDELEVEAFLNYIIEQSGAMPSKVNMEIQHKILKNGTGAIQLNDMVTLKADSNNLYFIATPNRSTNKNNDSDKTGDIQSEKDIEPDKLLNVLEQTDNRELEFNGEYGFIICQITQKQADRLLKQNGVKCLAHITTTDLLMKLNIRHIEQADKFKPACRIEKRLSKFFPDMKVQATDKGRIPCLTDQIGRIVWMYNLGFTDGYCPYKNGNWENKNNLCYIESVRRNKSSEDQLKTIILKDFLNK